MSIPTKKPKPPLECKITKKTTKRITISLEHITHMKNNTGTSQLTPHGFFSPSVASVLYSILEVGKGVEGERKEFKGFSFCSLC